MGYSDAYSDMKEICHNFLGSIMKKIKYELFIQIDKDLYENDDLFNVDTEELYKELKIQIDKNNEKEDNEECIIRTDEKYLEIIKKNENKMLLETKRRMKVKRVEVIVDKNNLEEGECDENDKKDKKDINSVLIKPIEIDIIDIKNSNKDDNDVIIKGSNKKRKYKKKKKKAKSIKKNKLKYIGDVIKLDIQSNNNIYLRKKTNRNTGSNNNDDIKKKKVKHKPNNKGYSKKAERRQSTDQLSKIKKRIKENSSTNTNITTNININQTRALRSLNFQNIPSVCNKLQDTSKSNQALYQ